jgi:hypothetical protein
MRKDLEHLNLLAIFHYVMGALTALAAVFPGLYLVLGILVLTGGAPGAPPSMGWMFALGGGGFALLLIGFGIVTAVAGYCLHRHKARVFCLVIAGFQCTQMPLGTILGIFTILVLSRDTVQELFAGTGRFRDPEEDDHLPPPHYDDRPAPYDEDRRYYEPRRDRHED